MATRSITPGELAEALRKLDDAKTWTNRIRKEYRQVGTKAAGWVRDELRSEPAQVARAAPAVRGGATAKAATVRVNGKVVPGAVAAIWGTKKEHTGFMAGWVDGAIDPERAAGFADAPRNTLTHVGNAWSIGASAGGPRGLNRAINRHGDELLGDFAAAGSRVLAEAFG